MNIVIIMQRCRNWILTSYKCQAPIWVPAKMRYLIFQMEKCPTTLTHHWQGFVQLSSPTTMPNLKLLLQDPSCHLEQMRGTVDQAIAYCKKELSRVNGPWEFGEPQAQGQRNDLQSAVSTCLSAKSLKEVASQHPATFVRYHRGLHLFRTMMQPMNTLRIPMEATLIWGSPRIGKTSLACSASKSIYWYNDCINCWFDFYDNQDIILIDDFQGLTPIQFMLRLCDKFPLLAPTKGSHAIIGATQIIILSNLCPSELYSGAALGVRSAFFARLDIYHATTGNPYPCQLIKYFYST